ncbi:hypothetical protein [Mesobacillus foraminis]|uniref:Uncharacterized protein n=1 Tax=Mesobacillus foraminis TaxID=279826 RepID=A0A4R2BG68_9BACI|nr:hypothetical protein [Mesobacillus foraminis]TCN25495.1 hypothetical protein EV146_105152 [Mesobacillus foraminis]
MKHIKKILKIMSQFIYVVVITFLLEPLMQVIKKILKIIIKTIIKHRYVVVIIHALLPLIPDNIYTRFAIFTAICSLFLIPSFFVHLFPDTPLTLILLSRIIFVFTFILVFTGGLTSAVEHLIKATGNEVIEEYIVFILLFFVITLFILFMLDYFLRLVKSMSELKNPKNTREKVLSLIKLFARLILSLIIPIFVFGICYSLILATLYNIVLNFWEAAYLSFVINYTLPVNGEIMEIFNKIDTSRSLRILEVVQLILSKILDLTVIAIIINYINDLVNDIRVKNKG